MRDLGEAKTGSGLGSNVLLSSGVRTCSLLLAIYKTVPRSCVRLNCLYLFWSQGKSLLTPPSTLRHFHSIAMHGAAWLRDIG
eukprot:2553194-Amphidinium_carterae.1